MYTLIKYDSGEKDIIESKRVKSVDGDVCSVKCPGGGVWRALRLAAGTQMQMICKKKKIDQDQEEFDATDDSIIDDCKSLQSKKRKKTRNSTDISSEPDDDHTKVEVKAKKRLKKRSKKLKDERKVPTFVTDEAVNVHPSSSARSNKKCQQGKINSNVLNSTFTVEEQSNMTHGMKKELIQVNNDTSNNVSCNLDQILNETPLNDDTFQFYSSENVNESHFNLSTAIEDAESSDPPSNITPLLQLLDPELINSNRTPAKRIVNYSITTSADPDSVESELLTSNNYSNDDVKLSNTDDPKASQEDNSYEEEKGELTNVSSDKPNTILDEDDHIDSSPTTENPIKTSTPVFAKKSLRFTSRISDILPVIDSSNAEKPVYQHLSHESFNLNGNDVNATSSDMLQEEEQSQQTEDQNTPTDDEERDPDYMPSTSAVTTNLSNITKSITINNNTELRNPAVPVNARDVIIPTSNKTAMKKQFCPYCNTLQSQLPRHLTLKHFEESDVKKFIHLPPKCPERKKIIEIIRNIGNYKHNTDRELNTGVLIVKRRRQEKFEKVAEDYLPCTNCKGFFSKQTLRAHFSRCNSDHQKGVREITVAGRRLTGYMDPQACPLLRDVIFPVLRDDVVSNCIKYDTFVIEYANRLCDKYTLEHQHDLIRSTLRLIGRFKLAIKKIDKRVEEFDSIFYPPFYKASLEALREVAHWDAEKRGFKTPAVAQHLSTLIRKMGKKAVAEAIQQVNDEKEKYAKKFLKLWDDGVPSLITKKALDNQIENQRCKMIVLPSTKDIKCLHSYVKKQAMIAYDLLQNKFDFCAWKLLNECVLILLLIFNRRRAGEIERLSLVNYNNKQDIEDFLDPQSVTSLSDTTNTYAKQFKRIVLRGKLNRTVPILLSSVIIQLIETLLTHRGEALVNENNPYLFAVPNTNPLKKKYIRACPLMRRFSVECGAMMPASLRGTLLRKHVATYTAALDASEGQIVRLANFLGHEKEIHKNIYRVSIPAKEITQVSKLLLGAMGEEEELSKEEEERALRRGFVVPNEQESEQDSESSEDEEDYHPNRSSIISNHSGNDNSGGSSHQEHGTSQSSMSNQRVYSSIDNKTQSKKSNNHHKKLKSKAGSGRVIRQTWSIEEKKAVASFFGDVRKMKNLPSLIDCQNAIKSNPVLKKRSAEKLKSWIDNQRRSSQRKNEYALKKSWR